MGTRDRRRRLAAVAALLALAGACSNGSKPEGASERRYGSGDATALDTPETTVTTVAAPPPASDAPATAQAAAPTTAAAPTPASPPPPGEGKVVVANRTERLDANGLELVLVVANKVRFASDEDITMELSFVNRGNEPLYRYAAQEVFFEIVGPAGTWTTSSCRPEFGGRRPPPAAVAMEPGEPHRFVNTYPGEPSPTSHDHCRVPAGDYDVTGIVDWCPPEAISRPEGGGPACDPAKVLAVRSAPLRITIT